MHQTMMLCRRFRRDSVGLPGRADRFCAPPSPRRRDPRNHPGGQSGASSRRGNDRIAHCPTTMCIGSGWFSLLLALTGLVLMLAPTAQAATINVSCSVPALISAIITANATPGGGDTLELASECTYALTTANNVGYHGNNGLPQITNEMTINAHGAVIERSLASGIPDFRLIQVNANGNLTLNDATIRNGVDHVFPSNEKGGGMANLGTLKVTNSTFSNNLGGCGGAIYTKAEGVAPNTLIVMNSVFFSNTADG
jgi:hypothetical protein